MALSNHLPISFCIQRSCDWPCHLKSHSTSKHPFISTLPPSSNPTHLEPCPSAYRWKGLDQIVEWCHSQNYRVLEQFCPCVIMALQKELTSTSIKLEIDQFNNSSQMHVAQIQHQVGLYELYEAKRDQLKSQVHWLDFGDRVTKKSSTNFDLPIGKHFSNPFK